VLHNSYVPILKPLM